MTFIEAMRAWVTGTLRFGGRSPRAEVAWVLLVHVIVMGLGTGFAGVLGVDLGFGLWIAWPVLTATPTLALVWRRLHDMDSSGWWAVAFLPFLLLAWTLPFALVALAVIPGTPARNRFGPRPGARENVADVFR